MDAINLPVTAVITLMIGCTILAVAFVDGVPLTAGRMPGRGEETAMTTVGERLITRAMTGANGANGADVERLVEEARATYGEEGLPLLQEGAERLMDRSDDERTRGMVQTVRRELDQIALDEKSAAPLSSGAEPNTEELTTH